MPILKAAKVLYKDKLAAWLLIFSILFILATWVLFLFKRVEPSPLAVLHYNIYAGIDTIGHWYWLYIIPAIFLSLSIINLLLAIFLWTKNRIYSYFLLTTILIINFIIFLYLFNILNYNI